MDPDVEPYDPSSELDLSVFELRPLFLGILFRAYGIDSPCKVNALASTYRTARSYLAPIMVKTSIDMLPFLQDAMSGDGSARVVFAGRDSFTLGYVIHTLDPDFFRTYCRNLYLTRRIVDDALADLEAAGQSFTSIEPFRKRSTIAPDTAAWQRLRHYFALNELDLDEAITRVVIVDTGYKGSIQEMLAALHPHIDFHGHYVFHSAALDDPHPGTKRGHELHLDADRGFGGTALRGSLPDDDALTFAHHEAIVAVEELLQGSQLSPTSIDPTGRPPLTRARRSGDPFAGLNPIKVGVEFCDPMFREAVLSFNVLSVSHLAAEVARQIQPRQPGWHDAARRSPWYGRLTTAVEALRTQLRKWISEDPVADLDSDLRLLLDSFVHRADRQIITDLAALLARSGTHPLDQIGIWAEMDSRPAAAKAAFLTEMTTQLAAGDPGARAATDDGAAAPLLRKRATAVDALVAAAPALSYQDAAELVVLVCHDHATISIIAETLARSRVAPTRYLAVFKTLMAEELQKDPHVTEMSYKSVAYELAARLSVPS